MRAIAIVPGLLLSIPVLGAGPALGAGFDPVTYVLTQGSTFEYGCFGPCECPVFVRSPVTGTFRLTKTGSDPLYDYYDVSDVRWKVPGTSTSMSVVGSGTYRRGGEVAIREELILDLSIDGGSPLHFDSGLVDPQAVFPDLHTLVSRHNAFCFDTAFVVVAQPVAVAGADAPADRVALALAPNPFVSSITVGFSLPRDGFVDLRVYDVSGRALGTLARHEWLPLGHYERVWDGRVSGGKPAPAGRYLVRLETAAGTVARTIVKLR
jgi:hypothetical protein